MFQGSWEETKTKSKVDVRERSFLTDNVRDQGSHTRDDREFKYNCTREEVQYRSIRTLREDLVQGE